MKAQNLREPIIPSRISISNKTSKNSLFQAPRVNKAEITTLKVGKLKEHSIEKLRSK